VLTLKVENFDRLGDGGPLSFEVDRRGFDFGRDQHLDWTLPDPTRKVSGKHSTILYEKGGYYLYDVSTNGTFVNGSSRRVQSPYELKHGDELAIGDYVVSVSIAGQAAQAPAPMTSSMPAGPAPVPASSSDIWAVDPGSVPPLRREDLMPPRSQPSRGPDFLSAVAAPLPDVPAPPRAAPPPSDPWGTPSVPPHPRQPVPPPDDDWTAPSPSAPIPPAAAPVPPPAVPHPPQQAYVPPPPVAQPVAAPPVFAPQHMQQPPAPPAGVSVSSVVRDVPFPPARPQAPPRAMEDPRRASPPPAPPAGGASAEALRAQMNQELLRRFAEGANIPSNLLGDRSAADLAFEMGEIFKVVCANLMQLLKARAEMKSVVRTSERTMIEARENNALKFTPSPEAALAIMFGQPAAGYLDPRATIERSFGDLKLHEAATFSAMQQAVIQLMEDLSPESIEQAAGGNKLGFLSGKSKQWELFCERWKAKAGASEHGLLDAFLDEFAAYYDAAIPRRRQ
jgi:type VI secretion system protein ImpI